MKIGIDISNVHVFSQKRGIGFYTKNLFDSLKKFTQEDVVLIEDNNDNEKQFDVIHYPFFDLFRHTLPILKRTATVVTIHDVIPLIFPQYYPPGFRGLINLVLQKLSLRNIKAVITDSDSSKKDIIRYLKIHPDKIFPIPLAPAPYFRLIKDKIFLESLRVKYKLPQKFVLYYGDVNWNKNLINLAKACLEADIDLVLAGSGFEQKDLDYIELQSFKQFLKMFGDNPQVHKLGFVPNGDLVGIINLAKAVLLPSFYEGFGLPILEAQACGTPVITANVSSMPKVAGEGAALVSPKNVDEISQTIVKVTGDRLLRERLIQLGFKNVRNFSWMKTTEETMRVYSQVLRKHP